MGYLSTAEIEANFIDDRNKGLWDKLNNKFIICVNDDYQIYELKYINNDPYVVILTDKKYSKALFTHELLHLDLRYNGLNTELFFQSASEPYIPNMTYMIINCIEHILFFDEFIEMGYKKEDFVMDYNNSEYTLPSLIKLYDDFKSFVSKPILELFLVYIFWIFKGEEYIGVDRTPDLEWLRKKEPIQFSKCETMFDEIIDFDLENTNVQSEFEKLMRQYLKRKY